MKSVIPLLFSALITLFVFVQNIDASNLPRSHQCTLIESVSPTEVMVHATGIGHWQKGDTKKKERESYLLTKAELDARRAALWFLLYGSTDPLLSTDVEKNSFARIQEEFFREHNIVKFISWEGSELLRRIKRELKRKKEYELTIEKAFKINKQAVQAHLVEQGVLIGQVDLIELIGMPFVMVIPESQKDQDPVKLLATDTNLGHASKVIESYLTSRRYDVIVPEQLVVLNELNAVQMMLKDVEEDYGYKLALSIGSDVYITYDVQILSDKYNTQKAVVNVRAFETTTARLLGTETGYSPASNSTGLVLIEQAINDAIDKVLSRINAYWKDDIGRGIQYKLIVSISKDFNRDQAEQISFVISDILRAITKNRKFKENIVTDQTLDYLLWCDVDNYGQSTQVYRTMKDSFSEMFSAGNLRKINVNRKLILLAIDMN